MVKAVLLKPLDGQPEGSERDFDKADFDALRAMGAVRKAPAKKAAPAPLNKMAPAPASKVKA